MGDLRLVKLIAVIILILSFFTQAGATAQPGFLIDTELLGHILIDENPLPYLEEPLRVFFKENPTATAYFASEINLNNGSLGWGNRKPVGERYMFGKATNAAGVKAIMDTIDHDVVYEETLRLLFGPWYSKNAGTTSVQKNLGWFPMHLDLTTGEWFRTDPRTPDLGIRVFHYTDYDGRNRTTTLALTVDWDTLDNGYYTCYLTVIRKPW